MAAAYAFPARPAMLVLALLAVGCAHSSPATWNGNWKLNTNKSRMQGGSYFTIAKLPDGGTRVLNDAFNFDFRCNGKNFQNPNGRDLTTSCVQEGASEWKLTYKRNGIVTSEVLWDLSPDGKVLTIHGTNGLASGTPNLVEHIYRRSEGTDGLAGRWEALNPFEHTAPILSLSVVEGRLHYAYPSTGEYVDAPLDGADAPMHTGPQERQGFSMSIRQVNSMQMRTKRSFEGRVIREGTLVLSNDGRTITAESWVPGHTEEKDTYVYEKQ